MIASESNRGLFLAYKNLNRKAAESAKISFKNVLEVSDSLDLFVESRKELAIDFGDARRTRQAMSLHKSLFYRRFRRVEMHLNRFHQDALNLKFFRILHLC